MSNFSRRRFLICLSGAGATAATAAWGLARSLQDRHENGVDSGPELKTVSQTSHALGSDVTITALHADANVARRAIDEAFAELKTVEAVMSIYRPESQLSLLNRDGEFHRPHPYLVEVLGAGRAMSEKSDGAFDVTVQPLWTLFQQAKNAGTLPSPAEIETARQRINWRQIELSDSHVRLLGVPRGEVTLNGIAQGFAADRVTATLRSHGIKHALVDTGELSGLGVRPGTVGWQVGIQHPRHDDAFISIARLAGRCLATSGDYATTFSDDFQWHHLFDPRTGQSPRELMSVSIAANTGLDADALSTAVFVLGAEAGEKLVRATPGADAFFVLRDGRTLATPGFPFAT